MLELAAGTGVVTRQLAVMLEPSAEIVATDLNPAMIEEAARIGTARRVEWRRLHERGRHRPVAFTSRSVSPGMAALAYCQGTPLRGEIEARDPQGLARATAAAEAELARRFGDGPIEGRIEALVVTVHT